MKNYIADDLKAIIAVNDEKTQQIIQLSNQIINEKKLRFDSRHLESYNLIKDNVFIQDGLIDHNGMDLSLIENEILLYVVVTHFESKYNFFMTPKIEEIQKFIEKIATYFVPNGNISGINGLMTMITQYLFLQFYRNYPSIFLKYIMSINSSQPEFYDTLRIISRVLPKTNYESQEIYNFLVHIVNQISTQEGIDIRTLMPLYDCITEYAIIKPTKASNLLEHILNNHFEAGMGNFAVAIIKELNKIGLFSVEKCFDLMDNPEYQTLAITVFSNIIWKTEADVLLALEKVEKITPVTQEILLQKIPLYSSFIQLTGFNKEEINKKCFAALEQLIVTDDAIILVNVIGWLSRLDGFIEPASAVIYKYIISDKFNTESFLSIDQFLTKSDNINITFKIFKAIGQKLGLNFRADNIKVSSNVLRSKYPFEFDKRLLESLTADEGYIRWTGLEILKSLNTFHNGISLNIDWSKVDFWTQFRFIITIATPYLIPAECLPMVVGLFQSNYDEIKQTLLIKICQLTESFKSEIVTMLEELIENSNSEKVQIIEKIKTHLESFRKSLARKDNIKELNPAYTQVKQMRIFMQSFSTRQKKEINATTMKHSSFLQFAKKITVSRGGGWRPTSGAPVQEFQTMSFTRPIERDMFVRPEQYDLDFKMQFLDDWSTKFK